MSTPILCTRITESRIDETVLQANLRILLQFATTECAI
jgi:hypothetical protein